MADFDDDRDVGEGRQEGEDEEEDGDESRTRPDVNDQLENEKYTSIVETIHNSYRENAVCGQRRTRVWEDKAVGKKILVQDH